MPATLHRSPSIILLALLSLELGGCNLVLQTPNSQAPQNVPRSQSTLVSEQSASQCVPKSSAHADSSLTLPSPPIPPTKLSWTTPKFDQSIGIGYLGPLLSADAGKNSKYADVRFGDGEWLGQFMLPLYTQPQGSIKGWMACGWLITSDQKEALKPQLFYPGYSGFGFIVLEERGNEWIKLRYADSDGVGNGVAWVKPSHLQLGTVPLRFIRWRDRYQAMITENFGRATTDTKDWGFFFFRSTNTNHALRAKPSEQSTLVTWIGPEHSLLPLKIEGDWMYVRVNQPSNYCISDWQGRIYEGWIRWMDPQEGNGLAEPYKGC